MGTLLNRRWCPWVRVWITGIARTSHYLVAGRYRPFYYKHLEDFDWFLNTDDDVAWTAEAIQRVAREYPRFDGTKLVPGVLVFEKALTNELSWHYPHFLRLRSKGALIQAIERVEG